MPHRAIYDVELNEAAERSGIKAMSGRIVYEVRGNECEGMTVQYRFLTDVRTASDKFISDQHTSTFESPDGSQFTFLTKSFVNERLERTVAGSARRGDGGLQVELSSPQERELALGDASFITSHLVDLLDKARRSERFVRTDLFDGSDAADEVVATTSVIAASRIIDGKLEGEGDGPGDTLSGLRSWPVTMSYFDKDVGRTGEHVPVYEASFLLYENGVTRKLVMRYPDYSLKAHMQELELFAVSPCEREG